MLFNTNIFIFVFLPAALLVFFGVRRRFGADASFLALFLMSLIFYGWWDVRFLPLLVGSIAVNLMMAHRIAATRSKGVLLLGIGFNLALLGIFKYLNLFDRTLDSLFGLGFGIPPIVLPIGISFYTFQQIAYLVDVYARQGEERPQFHKYGLFVCFFPQLIAGPIVHHKEMMTQFENPVGRNRLLQMVALGLIVFAIGLSKKVLIADPLGAVASPIFFRADTGGDIHFFIAWVGTLAYTFQIYFDFSGYSDMAIGLALMFGVQLPANFDSPYKSRSIIDFWRRWHMTLSRFLRDYVYIPLGGSRHGQARRLTNLMIVMLVGGMWHGAAWTFMLWGGLHGLYLMVNHSWRFLCTRLPAAVTRPINALSWPITFLAVVLAWVTFRAATFDGALAMYGALFGFNGLSVPLEFASVINALGLEDQVRLFAENSRSDFYIGGLYILGAGLIAFLLPNSLQITQALEPTVTRVEAVRTRLERAFTFSANALFSVRGAVCVAILFYLSIATINAGQESEFLYFQF